MKLEINPWLSHTITVLAVVLLVGFAVYITPTLESSKKIKPEHDEEK